MSEGPGTETVIRVAVSLPSTALEQIAGALSSKVQLTSPSPPWMGVPEAASYLATTEDAIRKAVQRHQIPFHQPLGPRTRYLIDRRELDAWVRGEPVPEQPQPS